MGGVVAAALAAGVIAACVIARRGRRVVAEGGAPEGSSGAAPAPRWRLLARNQRDAASQMKDLQARAAVVDMPA